MDLIRIRRKYPPVHMEEETHCLIIESQLHLINTYISTYVTCSLEKGKSESLVGQAHAALNNATRNVLPFRNTLR